MIKISQVMVMLAMFLLAVLGCDQSEGPALVGPQDSVIPDAPGELLATATSSTNINLTWTDNSASESGFRIFATISAASGTGGRDEPLELELATVEADRTGYSHTGLVAGTTVHYRVHAFNSEGVSEWSNNAIAKTVIENSVPQSPSSLTAVSMDPNSLSLEWRDNSDNEHGFRVRMAAASSPETYSTIAMTGSSKSAYTVTGLQEDQLYRFHVAAYNNVGESTPSNDLQIRISDLASQLESPSNLTAVANSSSQIKISWTDHADGESGFQIERSSVGPSSSFAEIGRAAANVTSFEDSGLPAQTDFWYRVRAYTDQETSSFSNVAWARTKSVLSAPAAPTELVVDVLSATQALLSWKDNSDNETGFEVQRSDVSASDGFEVIAEVARNVVNFTDWGLDANKNYWYRVRASGVVNTQFSAYSNIAHLIREPTPTLVRILNESAAGLFLDGVAQLKIVPAGEAFASSDLLADDGKCWPLPQNRIGRGQSMDIEVDLTNYRILIGMGRYECDQTGLVCLGENCWWKRLYTTDTDWNDWWVWIDLTITGHETGVVDLKIVGDYRSTSGMYVESQALGGSYRFMVSQQPPPVPGFGAFKNRPGTNQRETLIELQIEGDPTLQYGSTPRSVQAFRPEILRR